MAYSRFRGLYTPLIQEKWSGDVNNIIFRSQLEFKIFRKLERMRDIIEIKSEELIIPYYFELDKKWHRYFPDLTLKVKQDDEIINYIVEIKPSNETKPPRKIKNQKRYIKRVSEFLKNKAKWEATIKYCEEEIKKTGQKFQFLILTEKDI